MCIVFMDYKIILGKELFIRWGGLLGSYCVYVMVLRRGCISIG